VKPFLIIGSANVDFIMRVGQLPDRGETVTASEFAQMFGGKGANQAVAAARAGASARLIACLGNDPYASLMLENFQRDGLDVSSIARSPGLPSGSALIMIEEGGMNFITVSPGANGALSPADIRERRSIVTSAGLILLQMEIPVETNLEVLAIATEAGVPVMMNYAPARLKEPALLTCLETLIVNETETHELVGIHPTNLQTAQKAAGALLCLGPKGVLITMGESGSWFQNSTDAFHTPVFPVKAVDSTASGDTFCGAFGVAILEGLLLREAVRFASAAAALSVTRLGAQPSIPLRVEIDEMMKRDNPADSRFAAI